MIVVGSVLLKGASALNWDFFFKTPAVYGATGGGIANAIVGTAVLVGLATLMAVPVGILVAIYLSEFARPSVATPLRVMLDVFIGIPSIVIGIFVFALLVVGNGQSGWAGAFALALIMLPYVARGTDEVLTLTASSTREASLALGASTSYTVDARDAADRSRRHRHVDDPRDRPRRRRDRAAVVRLLDRGERGVRKPRATRSRRSRSRSSRTPSRRAPTSTHRRGRRR